MFHERLAAVVSGPHHDICSFIELLGDFMRMEPIHGERYNTNTRYRRVGCIDMYPFDLFEPGNKPLCQHIFVIQDLVHANLLEILRCNTKTNSPGDIRGPRFIFLVAFSGGISASGHRFNHPATQYQRFQDGLLHPEDTCTGWSEHLVARKGKKITTKPGNIDRHMGNLSLIHISEPTRQAEISYAVF